MLTLSEKTVKSYIKTLEAIWDNLNPKDEIVISLLNDALQKKYHGGIYTAIQQRLITLNMAQKHIEQAIAAFQIYKSLS